MLHPQALKALSALIDVCEDTAQGFDRYAQRSESPLLAAWLLLRANESRQASRDLQTLRVMIAPLDPWADDGGRAHERRLVLNEMLDQEGDEAILEACECYEDLALAIYHDALKASLPATLGAMVSAQYQELQRRRDALGMQHNQWFAPMGVQNWAHGGQMPVGQSLQ